MTKEETLKLCRGCRDDFYNDHNPMGVKECWMLKDAKMVTKYAIGYWTPMDTAKNLREVKVLNCYHEQGSGRSVYMTQVPAHLKAEWNELQKAGVEVTFPINGVPVSLTPAEELQALVDRNRYLEQELTRKMDECDYLRSCVRAEYATIQELQQAMKVIAAPLNSLSKPARRWEA